MNVWLIYQGAIAEKGTHLYAIIESVDGVSGQEALRAWILSQGIEGPPTRFHLDWAPVVPWSEKACYLCRKENL
jgi:hypothetical protein